MQNREHAEFLALAWGFFLVVLVMMLVFLPLRQATPIVISSVALFGLGFGLAKMLSRPGRARWALVVWIIMSLCAIYSIKFLHLSEWVGMPGSSYLFGYSVARLYVRNQE